VTVKLQVLELPAASVAVACTVVVPTGKLEPETWSVPTVGTEQLSVAVAVKLTGAAQVPAIAFTVIFAGHEIDGGVLSMTVIVCDALAVLVAASVAVKVRVIISGLAIDPAPPLFVSDTITVGVPQLSDAVACVGSAAGTSPAH
jgi:hypothetical protein